MINKSKVPSPRSQALVLSKIDSGLQTKDVGFMTLDLGLETFFFRLRTLEIGLFPDWHLTCY